MISEWINDSFLAVTPNIVQRGSNCKMVINVKQWVHQLAAIQEPIFGFQLAQIIVIGLSGVATLNIPTHTVWVILLPRITCRSCIEIETKIELVGFSWCKKINPS